MPFATLPKEKFHKKVTTMSENTPDKALLGFYIFVEVGICVTMLLDAHTLNDPLMGYLGALGWGMYALSNIRKIIS